ncbi:uncharacterized protein LOC112904465 [Agrilus planipennis]|uniref:Uncharacterized protein LOC112904465 n=1 Tax=Agrilus planipennis TaxID=224129 RepID=A0A7F5R4E0_AGRPL|nr:uncharacterized protein LOC112904465 [Agrilus planipennis]
MAAGMKESKWDTLVKPIQGILNSTENKTIGVSHLEVLAGYKGRNIAEAKILSVVQNEVERLDLQQVRENVSKRIVRDQNVQKKRFDKTRKKAKQYTKGEIVMILKTSIQATGSSQKLTPSFRGPFKITSVLYKDKYEVEDLREGMKRSRTVVTVDEMKPWILLRDDDSGQSQSEDDFEPHYGGVQNDQSEDSLIK